MIKSEKSKTKSEDKRDIKSFDMAYEEYLKDPKKYSMDEVKEMLGLTKE